MVIILDNKQYDALKQLGKAGLQQSEWTCISLWQYMLNFAYTLLLCIDILGHFIAAPSGEDSIEGIVTLSVHLIVVLLAYPVLAVQAAGRMMCASFLLLLAGVTDFDMLFGRAALHDDIMHAKAYALEGAELEMRHMVSITKLFAKRAENLSLRFYLSLIVFLPMLIIKAYFAINPEYYTCTISDVTRIGIIFFTFIGLIVACAFQEHTLCDYLKAANFQDYVDLCVRSRKFNGTLQTSLTLYLGIGCKVFSLVYRGYSILTYLSMSVLFGIANLVFIFVVSVVHHIYQRPAYENPAVGIESWWNDLLEIWARIFFMRGHRFSPRGLYAPLQLWFIWAITLLIQHFGPLFSLTKLYPMVYHINGTLTSSPGTCTYGFYGFLKDVMFEVRPATTYLTSHRTFYFTATYGTIALTALLACSLIFHLGNLIYLSSHEQTDNRFPSFVAADIWCNLFLRKNWALETSTAHVQKILVLSLIDEEGFEDLLNWLKFCPTCRPILPCEWRSMSILASSTAPATPDIDFMRCNMLQDNPRREFFEPMIDLVYQPKHHSQDNNILKRCLYVLIDDFEGKMAKMNSPRITATREILKKHGYF